MKISDKVTKSSNGSHIFTCETRAYPEQSIAWYKIGGNTTTEIVSESDRYEIETENYSPSGIKQSNLTLKNLGYTDGAIYQCFANNSEGNISGNAILVVEGQ